MSIVTEQENGRDSHLNKCQRCLGSGLDGVINLIVNSLDDGIEDAKNLVMRYRSGLIDKKDYNIALNEAKKREVMYKDGFLGVLIKEGLITESCPEDY